MAYFGIRFDLRDPGMSGVSPAARYRAALDMAEWADHAGFVSLTLSEHHGSPDGYLPSPLVMAAAVAARTERITIQIAAMVASFHDPIRLAEDAAVVDLLSAGRLELVVANGYVAEEFDMFGVSMGERVARTTEMVRTLRAAWSGEPFEHRGRTVNVTPRPHRERGPKLAMGGSSGAAARRAARLGVSFRPSNREAWDVYRAERVALGGSDPGEHRGGDSSATFVTVDVDQAWEELGPYLLHEVQSYGAWAAAAGADTGYTTAADVDELRASGRYRVLTPDQLVEDLRAAGTSGFALFHPLMGGIPPDLGWRSLRLLEREVLPRLS